MIGYARAIRTRRAMPAARAVTLLTAAAIAVSSGPAWAQGGRGGGLPIIRDTEIEQLLRDYTTPLLKVAGLAPQNIQVVIIEQKTFNAFVMDGRRIFVNAGPLSGSTTPNQIIGVLAHESGHISGGHLSKMRQEIANASTQMILATILGVGAMVAASATGTQGAGQIGMAALSAPQEAI